MSEEKKGILKRLANLLTSPIQYKKAHEPTVAASPIQQILLSETDPLEKPIILGPLFPSKTAERWIIQTVISLTRQIRWKRYRSILTFHFRDGSHFDITVSRLYELKRYKGGSIVRIDKKL